jgi:hypothetical protein
MPPARVDLDVVELPPSINLRKFPPEAGHHLIVAI